MPKEGTRVELIHTTDRFTKLEPGATGMVRGVDDAGTVHVRWDNGTRLGLVPGEDQWRELPSPGFVTTSADYHAVLVVTRFDVPKVFSQHQARAVAAHAADCITSTGSELYAWHGPHSSEEEPYISRSDGTSGHRRLWLGRLPVRRLMGARRPLPVRPPPQRPRRPRAARPPHRRLHLEQVRLRTIHATGRFRGERRDGNGPMKPAKPMRKTPSLLAGSPGARRVVLYSRIGREVHYGPIASDSLHAQHEAIRRLAAEMGMSLDPKDFVDEGNGTEPTGGDAP